MSAPGEFLSGVIEGFYGRSWSFNVRSAYADFLAHSGLNTCLYCPKNDPFLRKQWQQAWPQGQSSQLQALAREYALKGVYWGVGLSPFALYRHYGSRERRQLQRKLADIEQFEAPLLAILFDDMPGDIDALAARQAEIISDVCRWSPGVRVLACPTYYSFDPVLEKHFGSMPANYWADLGREMPNTVDIFWTGNKVCSESVRVKDIESINQQLGRRVMLWDNYPVNDGAVRSNSLYLEKLNQRDSGLREQLSGHLCNPMNQGLVSLPALLGLVDLYGSIEPANSWLLAQLGTQTWDLLCRDSDEFLYQGIAGMGPQRCSELALEYTALPGEAAAEVAGWLQGEYTFDPACLTD
jgi:hypothetical protein